MKSLTNKNSNPVEALIEIKNLEKSYKIEKKTLKIIKNLNLTINQGEFISIMGASGSGKSTLLHILAGLDKPTNGTVTINNQHLQKMSDSKLSKFRNQELGFVFQDFNLLDYLNIEENIALPLRINQQKQHLKPEQKIYLEKLLQQLGLNERRFHLPKQISGGQKQRVAIGRALIMQPKILLADEPTGNLDSQTGKRIIELIKKIHQKNQLTTIIITHDPEIAAIADRVIEIQDGEIIKS